MKRFALSLIVLALAMAAFGCSASQQPSGSGQTSQANTAQQAPDYSKLVTPADVEKVSGTSGIKFVPRDPAKGAGGDINFAAANGDLVLMANFGDKAWFEANKKTPNYRGPVSGIGDAAFNGPTAEMGTKIYQLGFVKNDTGVLLTSFLGPKGEPILAQAKLEELAKVVLGRIQ